ncbi:MAG: MaoC family dehydratase N-terminal domain-containing protein [Ktedonobacteraceae bacterium]
MFDKNLLGHSFPPFTFELTRVKIHELALAIGDENAIYHDSAAARAAGYEDIPFPPTGPTLLTFWANTRMWQQMRSAGLNVERILHGEEEYEYLAPIKPTDALTGIMTIVDGKTRRLKDGTMDIVVVETRYTNQHNEHVLQAKTMFVIRE